MSDNQEAKAFIVTAHFKGQSGFIGESETYVVLAQHDTDARNALREQVGSHMEVETVTPAGELLASEWASRHIPSPVV